MGAEARLPRRQYGIGRGHRPLRAQCFRSRDLGHVAYVAQVNSDGTIVVEDYNWAPPHAYSNPPRVIPASVVTSFIHIVS
jgi:surface antigen